MTIDLHHLLAPYVLDALEPDERHLFEAHLEQCELCRSELGGFVETANRLGGAEAEPPPPGLRDRLMAMAAITPQERPVVTAIAQRSRLRRALPRIAVAAAAVVAAVSIAGFVAEHQKADDLRAERAEMVAVLTSSDAAMSVDAAAGGASVRVISSPSHDAAVVVGTSLRPLRSDEVYQLWTVHDGRTVSAGVMGNGPGMMLVDGIKGVEALAVTVEPKGGSKAPTSDPILSASI
jgi:anti-sigma-K factor RskA